MEGAGSVSVELEDAGTEEDFQKVLSVIGGKERIYLVSDACLNPQDESGILNQFIWEMFDHKPTLTQSRSGTTKDQRDPTDGHHVTWKDTHLKDRPNDMGGGGASSDSPRLRTTSRSSTPCSRTRTIDCNVIILLFTQTFISNRKCLKEVLKDVLARTKRATVRHPVLIGLVGTETETEESRRCTHALDQLMRTVFRGHGAQSIWVSWFCPGGGGEGGVREVKRNMSRVIYENQTADHSRDRRNHLLWPFLCLFWSHRGAHRHGNNSTAKWKTGDAEEAISLETNPLSAGVPVDGTPVDGQSATKHQ